jgi:inner membrane transporter RhtA
VSERSLLAPPESAAAAASLVLVGAIAIQWAASLALPAFGVIGPLATSGWRFAPGAVLWCALVRPKPWRFARAEWSAVIFYGVATALMNLCFYQALARIPLGTAVAIEYLGPFAVVVFARRSWARLGFVVLALGGVVALTHPGSGVTMLGALFAALAAVGWASYVVGSHRLGGATNGFEGLATSMVIATACTFGFSASRVAIVVGHPELLARLCIMSTMAIVIGFGVEMQSLRRLRPSTVGILIALNPAVAVVVGALVANQAVTAWDGLGIALVVVAGVAVTVVAAREDKRDQKVG